MRFRLDIESHVILLGLTDNRKNVVFDPLKRAVFSMRDVWGSPTIHPFGLTRSLPKIRVVIPTYRVNNPANRSKIFLYVA